MSDFRSELIKGIHQSKQEERRKTLDQLLSIEVDPDVMEHYWQGGSVKIHPDGRLEKIAWTEFYVDDTCLDCGKTPDSGCLCPTETPDHDY